MVENTFQLDDLSLYKRICGFKDKNIKKIEDIIDVEIIPRGNTLIVKGESEKNDSVIQLFHLMSDYLHLKGAAYELDDFDVKYLATSITTGKKVKAADINKLKISFPEMKKTIVPRTVNQASYISAIHNNSITFGMGPAGTGKTYLAVVVALHYLLNGNVERIILTRPAVEAGESLGYLPGDFMQKVNPYLRPLYDALFDLQPMEKIGKFIEKGIIEIAPLAYMRGRTLNNAFIILDESQNTTRAQMKMFLTRLGQKSKIVISGDYTQIDLDKPKTSGLLHARKLLKNIKDISFIVFQKEDISRHPVVEKIVNAYEKEEETSKET